MISLLDLWLPILVSAVFVFIASSALHMAIPIHKNDFKKLANEANVLASMREHGFQQGSYMFPCAGSMKEMGTPEHVEKMNLGPVGFLTVMPSGPMNMGMMVFRTTAAVAVLGYAVSNIPDSIWKGVTWEITAKFVFDGVIYGLLTALAFCWLWPAAA